MIATTATESLLNWLEENQLQFTFLHDKVVEIKDFGKFLVIEPKTLITPSGNLENVIFDPEFQINLSDEENELVDQVDYLLFQFGNRWYYVNDLVPEEIKEFKYLGKAALTFSDTKFPYLGIHGGYELCNGSRNYEDWIKKAKFFNMDTLGICEENTLAGTLAFQDECKKAGIKPIIGETVTIYLDSKSKVAVKFYVQNEEGWKNLLLINKYINVDFNGEYVGEIHILGKRWEGLICVLTPEVNLGKYLKAFQDVIPQSNLYFQIDFVEWAANGKDEQWLNALKNYFDNWMDKIDPILICDSYYLDKGDHIIRKDLNNIGKVGFKNQSKDQFFKSIDTIYLQCAALFKEDDERWNIILEWALENLNKVCSEIDFKIPTGVFRLPKFEWENKPSEENENLFFTLIDKGLNELVIGVVEDEGIYFDRLEEEIEVIKKGGFIDYFLILWDVINWCKDQGIWVGMGRGSAAGSLVSYLLGIVKIDPIHYKLLFSRFLNAGRIGKSLPDVDLDFEGGKREAVLNYIKTKYGQDYFTAIGTFGTFKIKSALKDLSRAKGVDFKKTNYVASLIDDSKASFSELFRIAAKTPDIKKFVQKNHAVIEKIPLCMNQVKNASIHASGVVVVPKDLGGDIFTQMPVKKVDGSLVSEWEGEWIDKAGFLKFDILGVKQLDKFSAITELIKKNHGIEITYDSMDLEDEDVFDFFRSGYTEDVFQFGTQGLKAYCKEMRPDNIEDLIAAVALYRPSTMESGLHKEYIKIKHGIKKPVYDDGCYEATKDTFGIAIYQEQVMQICRDVAGFNLVEADDIRKAMGKKDRELLDTYKTKFIDGGVKSGFIKERVSELWDKLESFAGYGFNRSHAACYAIMGYFSQWLKVHYPTEYWTIALQFSEEKEIINRISEINKVSDIKVAPVDINKSTSTFFAEGKTIYWALNSVKWAGEKAVAAIYAERQENGEFFSMEEFCERIKQIDKSGVNKRVITNLILAGAFDKVEKINPEQRGLVINKYYNFTSQKLTEELIETEKWKPYQWVLKQKELTGFGFIDFSKIVKGSPVFAAKQKKFKENAEILHGDLEGEEVIVAGIIQNIYDKPFKGVGNRGLGANIELVDNGDLIRVTLWMDRWEQVADQVKGCVGKIMIVSGVVKFNDFKNCNVVQSSGKTLVEIV